MKFVFASYVFTGEFNNPQAWLNRINAYGGILEALAVTDTVISFEQIDYEGELLHNGVQHYFIRTNKKERLLPAKLHRLIKAQRPDVVVIQGMHFPLQIIQLRASLGRKVKIIVQHRAERPLQGLKKQLMRLADAGTDGYLFASKAMGQGWVDAGNISNADKIRQVMSVSSVFESVNRGVAQSNTGVTGSPNFLWVGNLNANKDPLTAIKAFLCFAKQEPNARLYIIHQTNDLLPQILQVLNSQPLRKNNVVLVGKIPHADLLYWFNSVDYILSSSHAESAGAAVSEAMSCGCIPILTDIDSFRIITANGRYGWLYPAGNETALFNILAQTPFIKVAKMRERVLAHFKSQLSFEAIAGQMKVIAESLFK